jgi:hypothetical protein
MPRERRAPQLAESIYTACSTARPLHDDQPSTTTRVDVDPSHYDPESLLAGALARPLRTWDKARGLELRDRSGRIAGPRGTLAPFDPDNAYVKHARGILRDEREDRDMPEGACS